MYLQWVAIISAVAIFAFFLAYFIIRNKSLEQAKKDPSKTITKEYDAIGRNIVVDQNGKESHV